MKSAFTLISTSAIKPNFFDKDYWEAEELGLAPDNTHSSYHLKFTQLTPLWFKQAVKQFVLFESATKTFNTCRSYIVNLTHFGTFIASLYPELLPGEVNRSLIARYLQYLKQIPLTASTRQVALLHLRTFHNLIVQEKWLPWPETPLVFNSDLPKPNASIPRYIPETVVMQLQSQLHTLSLFYRNLIQILLETGRRISEICPLQFDCLEQDKDGDYFLKVKDRKLKKAYLIPISPTSLDAIRAQQDLVKGGSFRNYTYLFPSKTAIKSPHVAASYINKLLNQLAEQHNIVDTNGKIWHFHAHQFRHTVGTRMINAGVPQAIVQKYLGHESPEMTSRYAHIHQETLKAAFYRFQHSVDIQGTLYSSESTIQIKEAKWLKHNIMAQALPNGICALPTIQNSCPHANACLTCVHFRTTKEFLPQHKEQLHKTNQIIVHAQEQGWQRQAEMNLRVKNNLENIIDTLEKTA